MWNGVATRAIRLSVRTQGFQPWKNGSIPLLPTKTFLWHDGIALWCNWQHNRFWFCYYWFESNWGNKMDGWPSGWRHHTANVANVKAFRRFKSFTIRNNIHPLPKRLREQSAKLLFVGSNPTRVSKGVVVQLVRIPALQAGGREFESHQLHKRIRGYLVLIADWKQEIVQAIMLWNGEQNKR